MSSGADRERLLFVVESGTDVRLVEGLAARWDLQVLARRIEGGVEVSQPPSSPIAVEVGPAGRLAFARRAATAVAGLGSGAGRGDRPGRVLVQGYGAAALAVGLAGRRAGVEVTNLVCSPVETYYACRREHADPRAPFRRREALGLLALARMNARLARHWVVLSRHLAEVVRGHGARAPIDVVPVYGVDPARFAPPVEPRAHIRRRLGLPDDGAPLVVFASRVAPEKDALTLLRAARLLRERGRAPWLLHRSGGWRELVLRATELGLADRVIATDAVHPERELPASLQAADLLVQASRAEGLGFSVLEAFGCETPVVASAVGGLRETVIDGETGWTAPPRDAPALAAAIAAALDDPAEALRRAQAGRRLVLARYERGAVFERLARALEAPGSAPPEGP